MASAQTKIILTVGNESITATLADNDATKELTSLLESGPITVEMNDYGGFEKVGPLPESLTTSNSQITTQPGDIMLYQGSNIVIFYGSNTWSYTRLGKIDEEYIPNLQQFLGSGKISLTITLDKISGIGEIAPETPVLPTDKVYDLHGNLVTHRPLSSGIYIINGKKIKF